MILLFLIAVIGLTHIVVDSEFMAPMSDAAKRILPAAIHHAIFECYQCSGFWCGLGLGWVMVSPEIFIVFACGCAGSFLANMAASVFQYLET